MKKITDLKKPIIGMIHLLSLPGYADSKGIDHVIEKAVRDLKRLDEAGIDGVLVENEYDKPHRVTATPEIIASMTRITRTIVEEAKCIVGIEILLNDPKASLAVAMASGASFIRTDYFVDRMSRPEFGGEMWINPKELIQYRSEIGASEIEIFADIHVKYAKMLEEGKTITKSTQQAKQEGAAAVLVSGNVTGNAPDLAELSEAVGVRVGVPVFVASGLNPSNAQEILSIAEGAIVGYGIKENDEIDLNKITQILKIRDQLLR